MCNYLNVSHCHQRNDQFMQEKQTNANCEGDRRNKNTDHGQKI